MNRFFKWVMGTFSSKELIVTGCTVLISGLLVSSIWWNQPENDDAGRYVSIGYDMSVLTATGGKVSPFHTSYYVYYDKTASESEKAQVKEVLLENVPPLHKIFDRVNRYYIDDNDPESEYMTTIKDVNESLGSGEFLEISEDLFNVLSIGKEMTIETGSAYNFFVGELSDFWNALLDDEDYRSNYQSLDPFYNADSRRRVEELQSFVPLTEEDVDEALTLKTENNLHYVKFDGFNGAKVGDLSITLGGISKGYANDVISEKLSSLGLTKGVIIGGQSSNSTLGDRSNGEVWEWTLESPITGPDFAFKIVRNGIYNMSTSGGYMGVYIPIDNELDGVIDSYVLRHHIIDAHTGYPALQQLDVNLLSKDFSSVVLDCLSTAFICLNEEDGMALRDRLITSEEELNVAWSSILADSSETHFLEVAYTPGYAEYMIRNDFVTYREMSL